MRIERIEIEQIKGIGEKISFPVGTLTLISGGNDKGKSTIIDAVRYVFDGGHDPDMLRKGAKKGRIVIKLDQNLTLEKLVLPKSSPPKVIDQAGRELSKPQALIEELASGINFDPLRFVKATKKERAQYLVEALNIRFAKEEIEAAAPKSFVAEALNIAKFEAFRKGIYDNRTVINRDVLEAEKTIDALERDLSDQVDTPIMDWGQEAARLQKELDDANAKLYADKGALDDELRRDLEEIDRQADLARAKARNEHAAAVEELNKKAQPKIIHLSATIRQASDKLAARSRQEGIKQTLSGMKARRDAKSLESVRLSADLDRLDALKAKKLAESKIQGVEVVDREVLVDGIPFDSLNTARQYLLCFQLASLKSGSLGLMIVDRIESFDPENLAMFKEAAKASGFQIIAARVTDGELKIESIAA